MARKILAVATLCGILFLTGCNRTIIDLTYQFDYAIIQLPDGTIVEGKVDNWTDYDGEQLQVCIDGVVYLTSSYNCVLIANKRGE